MISSCISSITSPKISKLIMLTNKLISTAITLRDTLARVHTYFWLPNRDKELMGKLPLVTAHLFQRFIFNLQETPYLPGQADCNIYP